MLGGLLLAEITGRTPVAHWGERSLFAGDGEGFCRFFAPLSTTTLEELAARADATLFPAGWRLATLGRDRPPGKPGAGLAAVQFIARPETILVCDDFLGVADLVPWIPPGHRWLGLVLPALFQALFQLHIRPRPEILATAADFRARHLADGSVTAVHVRGSDKVLEVPDVGGANRRCFDLADAVPESHQLFLMTDDAGVADAFRRRYGERLVLTDSRRTADATGIHYHRGEDGLTLGREVMVDLLLALEADRFIGNGRSNVSALIAVLREAAGRDSTLVLENQLLHHSCFL